MAAQRLTRSRTSRMIGGVCGGIAEYFDIDPVIIRLAFVLSLLAGGTGFIAYIVCLIVIPEAPYVVPQQGAAAPPPAPEQQAGAAQAAQTGQQMPPVMEPIAPKKKGNSGLIAGIILISLGVLFLLHKFVYWLSFGKLWPIFLIGIGVAILMKRSNNSQ